MRGNLVVSYNGLHCISGIASMWVVHIKCNHSLEKGECIQHLAVQEQRTGKAMDRDKLTSSANYELENFSDVDYTIFPILMQVSRFYFIHKDLSLENKQICIILTFFSS